MQTLETPPRTWGRPLHRPCGQPSAGNTPRTWGRLDDRVDRLLAVGNTPTDVGKTLRCQSAAAAGWKHPHGRGEDHIKPSKTHPELETPPRTWGRPQQHLGPVVAHGNTPTDVGKTDHTTAHHPAPGKHPHGRGEDMTNCKAPPLMAETPPRTWGRPFFTSSTTSRTRNTPTDVGKTSSSLAAM